MKRRDAMDAIQRALGELGPKKPGEQTRVGFVSPTHPSEPSTAAEPRGPEFEFDGWRFYTKTGLWEDEPTDSGDATVIAPNGRFFGFAWTAGSPLGHDFDFTPSSGPMLYVRVQSSVRDWDELRQQLLSLVPALDTELRTRSP